MSRKVTTEIFIADSIKIHGDKYDYTKSIYTGSGNKIAIFCKTHQEEFWQEAGSHLRGNGCSKCFADSRRLTIGEFIIRSNKIHNNKYDYSESIYINSLEKLKIICKEHRCFEQVAGAHLQGQGCPKCALNFLSDKFSFTKEEFAKKANIIHHNKYNYKNVVYKNSTTPVEIICETHGSFLQTPNSHIQGEHGCPMCGGSMVLTNKLFISKAKNVHGEKYNYEKVNYVNSHIDVEIICDMHGSFFQRPNDHISGGHGCKKCYAIKIIERSRSNTIEFIEKANILYDSVYDYSKTEYIVNYKKVIIICQEHGEFYKTPNAHLAGQGCQKCSGRTISMPEIEWLNSLGIPNDKNHRQVRIDLPKKQSNKKYIIADGFIPETNTIYEYLGDFYHGNPARFASSDFNKKLKKTYGKLYEEFLIKKNLIEEAGYTFIYIWENDYNQQIKENKCKK